MTRNDRDTSSDECRQGTAAQLKTRYGGRRRAARSELGSDRAVARDLIREVIENVAVPQLMRRHGSLPPTRRSRVTWPATSAVDLTLLARLLMRGDDAATAYVDKAMTTSGMSHDALMLDVLPRVADLLEADAYSGRTSSAATSVALSKLRVIALRCLNTAAIRQADEPVRGRVVLLSMIDDAASFDLVPYEYALWTANYEVANLEGASPKALMDELHGIAYDGVLVCCRSVTLRPALSRWLRAARVVARGRPKFVSVTPSSASGPRDRLAGCTASVYSARDAVAFMSEVIASRVHGFDEAETAFQLSNLPHYRSKSDTMPDYRRIARNSGRVVGPQPRALMRH